MGYSSYTPEFRDEAVRLVADLSRPVSDVARELQINLETLRVWVSRAKRERAVESDKVSSDEDRELRRLQRKIVDLEQENAFLKKAAAFFAAEPNNKNGSR